MKFFNALILRLPFLSKAIFFFGKKLIFLWVIGVIFLFTRCDKENTPKTLLRSAQGKPTEIVVVMDSVHRKGAIGDAVKRIVEANIVGVLQPEPLYKVYFINPQEFQGILQEYATVIIVTTFEQKTSGSRYLHKFFSKESIEKIKADTAIYYYSVADQFAAGQNVINLFGADEATLLRHLAQHEKTLQDFLGKITREKTREQIFSAKGEAGLAQHIKSKYNLTIQLPKGFVSAKEVKNDKDSTGFVWLRQPEAKFDRSVIIQYAPYRSEKQFHPDSIVWKRNSIAMEHLYEDPEKPDSYVVTEMMIPPVFQQISFNGRFAVEARGLWKTNNLAMGGSFISYVFADEKTQLIYYIEGFVYAPGMSKREIMKELETILFSVNTAHPIK
jgi:hypothetical protein